VPSNAFVLLVHVDASGGVNGDWPVIVCRDFSRVCNFAISGVIVARSLGLLDGNGMRVSVLTLMGVADACSD
jgi:hypothetical protein